MLTSLAPSPIDTVILLKLFSLIKRTTSAFYAALALYTTTARANDKISFIYFAFY
jgi:hypothetical protein